MAKKAYIGVENAAKRVRKIYLGAADVGQEVQTAYVGVSGAARRVKRAYIGVNGMARACWRRGEIAYHGELPSLPATSDGIAYVSMKRYALFASTVTYAYDSQYTRYAPSGLSVSRHLAGGAAVGTYALIGGGSSGTTIYAAVDAYDENLARIAVVGLSFAADSLPAGEVGSYAIFLGGISGGTYWTTANAYDAELTRSIITPASTGHGSITAARSPHYVFFAGGRNAYSSRTNLVDAYNAELTHFNPEVTSVVGREFGKGASTGKLALFGGGYTGSSSSELTRSNVVDAYNDSMTRMAAPALSNGVVFNGGGTLGEFGLFVGGNHGSAWTSNVDVYDDSLTKTAAEPISFTQETPTLATVDGEAMMIHYAGYTHVDAYEIV